MPINFSYDLSYPTAQIDMEREKLIHVIYVYVWPVRAMPPGLLNRHK